MERTGRAKDLAAPSPFFRYAPAVMLVARADSLAKLEGGLDRAASGRGQALLLRGEAGIGKSALLAEAVRHAEARQFTVILGKSWELVGPVASLRVVIAATTRDADPRITDRSGQRLVRIARDAMTIDLAPMLVGRDVGRTR